MIPGVILIVDDERTQRETLAGELSKWGHEVLQADGGEAALDLLPGRPVDLILTDLRMPQVGGAELLARCRDLRPDIAVVVMTAYGTIEDAVAAMKQGAVDFLTKPIDLDQLEIVVNRALQMRSLVRENKVLRRRLTETCGGFQILGNSPAMETVLARAGRAAETDATVLIMGESGTGKELLARSLHDLSLRAEGPFVAVNCAALPETLLESELFGHAKGAFTGADKDRLGRVQTAAGGTLFLDEIGDLTLAVQVKLLRFLQEREFTPVGSDKVWKADVRVVTATHRDLKARIKTDDFREDLFFRLNVVNLTLPPLRDRREDIPQLASHFLKTFADRYARSTRSFSSEAMACLMSYAYPGNVRELENIVEQTIVMTMGEVVHAEDLPASLTESSGPDAPLTLTPDMIKGDLPGMLESLERRIVMETLARFGGNQSTAARHLGFTESGLRYKLGKWKDKGEA